MHIAFTRRFYASRPSPLALLTAAVTALSLCSTSMAAADDLSDQLQAAARQITGTNLANTCLMIDDFSSLRNTYQPQEVQADNSGDPATHYSASTQGAYLGDAPAGAQPPAFIQALIDAGAVTPITLNAIRTVEAPVTTYIPYLQDLMNSPALTVMPLPSRPDVKQLTSVQGTAFVVTGADAKLFAPVTEPPFFGAPSPPELQTAPQDQGPKSPRGLWRTESICYSIKADRILEYGDLRNNGNGTLMVDAFVLFHPTFIPAWISDYRVTAALRSQMLPNDVRMVMFRNDGDGWRAIQIEFGGTIRSDLHLLSGPSVQY